MIVKTVKKPFERIVRTFKVVMSEKMQLTYFKRIYSNQKNVENTKNAIFHMNIKDSYKIDEIKVLSASDLKHEIPALISIVSDTKAVNHVTKKSQYAYINRLLRMNSEKVSSFEIKQNILYSSMFESQYTVKQRDLIKEHYTYLCSTLSIAKNIDTFRCYLQSITKSSKRFTSLKYKTEQMSLIRDRFKADIELNEAIKRGNLRLKWENKFRSDLEVYHSLEYTEFHNRIIDLQKEAKGED